MDRSNLAVDAWQVPESDAVILRVVMAMAAYPPPPVLWHDVERTIRLLANFRLALLEEEYDEWIDMRDGYDYVTGRVER